MSMTESELLAIYGQDRLNALAGLSPRAIRIVNLLTNGHRGKEIAADPLIDSTIGGVKTAKSRIYDRVGVVDDLQAGLLLVRTRRFIDEGLTDLLPVVVFDRLTPHWNRVLASMTAGVGRTYKEVALDLDITQKKVRAFISKMGADLDYGGRLRLVFGLGYEMLVNKDRSLTMDLVYLTAIGLTDEQIARKLNIGLPQVQRLMAEVYKTIELKVGDGSRRRLVLATQSKYPNEIKTTKDRYGLA